MYSRYICSNDFEILPPRQKQEKESSHAEPQNDRRNAGILQSIFGSGIKLPEMNTDTLILLALVYFLSFEPDDKVSDNALILAALFLMGL